VAGVYCIFAPVELIRAAGAIPVGLCGTRDTPIRAAEAVLPSNLCPLIKSSYGFAITGTCPFFDASDFIVAETTCDGKKKMYELLGLLRPLHLMHLPQTCEPDWAMEAWLEALFRLRDFLETRTGKRVESEELRHQIAIHNRLRRELKRITGLCANPIVPITGLDMLTVTSAKGAHVDSEEYVRHLEELAGELEDMQRRGIEAAPAGAPRILLTGCPVGRGSEKVLRLIEGGGGIVVCQEHCGGIKAFDILTEEDGDPYFHLASRYLRSPCSCMTPNRGRMELLHRLIREFHVQGVVDLTWQCCHTYNIESYTARGFVERELDIPFLHLETDYSTTDTGQLRTRIEAFLELVENR
jgi:benzoyl-CoA reductase/2-hydroxyglutaryl-CoA dehydratase subunit BcrC/BadD/HgdB